MSTKRILKFSTTKARLTEISKRIAKHSQPEPTFILMINSWCDYWKDGVLEAYLQIPEYQPQGGIKANKAYIIELNCPYGTKPVQYDTSGPALYAVMKCDGKTCSHYTGTGTDHTNLDDIMNQNAVIMDAPPETPEINSSESL